MDEEGKRMEVDNRAGKGILKNALLEEVKNKANGYLESFRAKKDFCKKAFGAEIRSITR